MIKISMIFYSLVFFITIFLIHVIIWRLFKPKNHIIGLVSIFILLPIFIFLLLLFYQIHILKNFQYLTDLSFGLILHLALAGIYIQVYPAIHIWAPSLQIVLLMGKKKKPVSFSEIKKIVTADSLILDKIYELSDERLISIKKSKELVLTKKGKFLANIFIFYRKLLKLKIGEG